MSSQTNVSDNTLIALPIFVQISEVIAREISAGRLIDGERLPPEKAMANEYGVAVGTLRKALHLLQSRGLLERKHGSGNYVKVSNKLDGVYSFFRLELLEGGGLPSAKLLSVDRVKKSSDLPKFGSSKFGFRFRRLRFLNNHPAALEEIWLDADCAKRVNPGNISESLYQFYKSKLGLWISRVDDRISISMVPSWTVDQFKPSPESVVGFVERLAYDQDGKSIEFSRNWFDPKIANYVSRLR